MKSQIKIYCWLSKNPIVLNFNWMYQYELKIYFIFKKYIYLPWKGPEMKINPVPMNIPSTQPVVFKCIFYWKEPGGKADPWSRVRTLQDDPGTSCYIGSREDLKDHVSQVENSGANLKTFLGSKGRTSYIRIITAMDRNISNTFKPTHSE